MSRPGGVPEWLKGTGCKPVGYAYTGSNPVSPIGKTVSSAEMKIDQLSRATGMTVRNIRAHQSRGLLPPPEVRGRTGYYGPEHQQRIELIQELQAEGLNLEAIKRLLSGTDSSRREVLDFARLMRTPFEDEEPEIIDILEIGRDWDITDPDRGRALLSQAEQLGFLRRIDEWKVEVTSPRLRSAANELANQGASPEHALEVLAFVRSHAEAISERYLEVFLSTVWDEFERAGRPAYKWPEVVESLKRLRPLAMSSVVSIFGIAMGETTEGALDRLDVDRGLDQGSEED